MRKIAILVLALAPSIVSAGLADRLSQYTKLKGPGLALLIVKDGKVVRKEGYGFANREAGVRINSKTNFNLASNSKQFTALAALLLERAGKLSPKDLVVKFIPELPIYAKDIKVGDLIHHTSGLPDYMELCDSKSSVTNKEVIAFLKTKASLDFPPGSKHEYSNTGYVVLSEVIERVSGVPFYEYIQNEIFKKLGMKTSLVLRADGKDQIVNRATSYAEWPFFERRNTSPCDQIYGDGGVLTSADDYLKWLNALTSPGLLSAAEQEKIFAPGTLADGKPVQYGYGWELDEYKGTKFVIHSGAWLAFRSFAVYVPSKKLWVAILSNYKSIPAWDLIKELAFEDSKAK